MQVTISGGDGQVEAAVVVRSGPGKHGFGPDHLEEDSRRRLLPVPVPDGDPQPGFLVGPGNRDFQVPGARLDLHRR